MTSPTPRESAISFLDRGLAERAEPLLEDWLREHPDDLYAWKLLVRRSADRLYGVRTDRLTGLLQPHGNRPEASLWRRFIYAEDLLVHDKPEESAEICQSIIQDGFDHPAVQHNLALARLRTDHPTEADAAFRAALALDPSYLPAAADYAVWLLLEGRLGRLEEATATLADADPAALARSFVDAEEAIRHIRDAREACAAMCECVALSERGHMREAAMVVWTLLRRFPESHLFLRTLIYLSRKNLWLPACRVRIQEILPDRERLRLFVEGVLSYQEEKYNEALSALDKAVEKGADHALVHCYRAVAFEALKRYDDEEAAMARAHVRQPWLIWPRAELAHHAFLRGDDTRVLELANVEPADRDRARHYDVTGAFDVALLERMALAALDRQGKIAEALARAEADPEPDAHEYLRFRRALVFARAGQPTKVADELSAVLDIGSDAIGSAEPEEIELLGSLAGALPGHPEIELVQALAYAYQPDLPEARRRLAELAGRFPDDLRIRHHFARVLWAVGETSAAQEVCIEHLDDRRLEGVLASILYEAGDRSSLRDLAAGGEGRTRLLEAALGLAKRDGLAPEADEIARLLLARDPGNGYAVVHLLERVDPDAPEFVEVFEHHVRNMPLDFAGRSSLALRLLEDGRTGESLAIYEDLVGKWAGMDGLALLGFGLGALAAAGATKEQTPES